MRPHYGAIEPDEDVELSIAEEVGTTNDADSSATPSERFLVLLLTCVMSISPHYGKHSLSSLAPSVISVFDIQRSEFGLFFSIQEVPGIILPVVGGFVLSHMPHGIASVILTSSMVLGQLLCALATSDGSVRLMLLGRFIFGFGDSLLIVLQGAIIARWFRSSHTSLAYGIMLLNSRLGSFSGFAAPGILCATFGLKFAMWFAVFVSTVSLSAAIVFAVLEISTHYRSIDQPASTFPSDFNVTEQVKRILHGLNRSFWLVTIIWMLLASSFFSLLDYYTDIFISRENVSISKSGLASGTILAVAATLSPIFGYMMDRLGYRPVIMIVSSALMSAGIFVLKNVGSSRAVSGFLTAGSFGLGPVTLLSCVALATHPTVVPAALGVYKSAENVGLAVTHYVTGTLRDWTGQYKASLTFLSVEAFCAVLVATALHFDDLRKGGLLSKPTKN